VEIFLNQPYRFIIRNVDMERAQYYHMATDIICISGVIYLLGGVEFPFAGIAYCAVILWAGTVSTSTAVFFSVVMSSLMFFGVVVLETLGFLPEVAYIGAKLPLHQALSIVAGNISFFFAFGYFSAFSSKLIRQSEKEKYEETVKSAHKFRAISYLVGNVAHDVVNYLANITGYSRLIEEDKSISGESSEMIRSICKLSVRGAELLSKLMKFSRNEENAPEEVNINKIIEDVMSLTEPLTNYSSITFKTDLNPFLPKVLGDKSKLQEVFTAFMLNSYEAIKGKGFVEIRTFLSSKDDGVCIMFSDTGVGMKNEDIAKVKQGEPFLSISGKEKKCR
jgi:signal transduction histidine kinase